MKKLSLILLTIFIVVTFGCVHSGIAFAATEAVFDNTNVLDDLNESKIAGEQFNVDRYGYSKEKQAQVLVLAEYGFNYDSSKQDNFGLYVYVYNPSGQKIGSARNKITIATVYENDKAVDYDPFELKLLSFSDGKYANLFYKFKVANATKILKRVSVNTNVRRYDVGEIELNFGASPSEAFTVGNYFEYSGFAKGCGADKNSDSTLACVSDSIEKLKLNVSSTYYRYNNGVSFQDNLSSVYFGVPSKTLEKYDKLQQIKANWYEVWTTDQLLINNKSLYNELVAATDANRAPNLSKFDYTGLVVKLSNGTPISGYGEFTKPTFGMTGTGYVLPLSLDWLFYSKTNQVSAEAVLQYAKDYTTKHGGELLLDKYSKVLFRDGLADKGRQAGWQGTDGSGLIIDADSKFDIDGFTMGDKFSDWWTKLFHKDLENDPITNILPIKIVEDKDILGSSAEVAERLLINEDDVTSFIAEYNANKVSGKKTVLFRFALTNYHVDDLYAEKYSGNNIVGALKRDKIGYAATQTAFLDFDIIWLKFVKEGVATVIPTVSNPIDIIGGLTPPLESDPFGWLLSLLEWLKENWWVIVVGIVAFGVVIGLIVAFIKFGFKLAIKAIGKALLFLLKWLPPGLIFTLLYYGIRGLKERKGNG